ncbi:patatin-like phospholipase family protein [Paracoccus sp. (in: a-proteobacteria)]|uniref:patatin-like phospholipase family protein n=1 Tax=Paracoccus sp. TaxID=267 RepID=UPI0032201D1D
MASSSLPINLALQGGGSHGALAWGVIDRLLEEKHLHFPEVSGTSAGAMNAAVLAHGLALGGRDGAKQALRQFWKAVSDAARFSPIQRSLWDRMQGNYTLDNSPGYLIMSGLSQILPPQVLNPLDYNPLRNLVEAMIDFDAINASKQVRLHLTATNVRTGQARIFSTGEISVDSVMASACLPQMYRAVEIDGEAYWDGGFSANPALKPLAVDSPTRDLLILNLNPLRRNELPRTARDIINRVNEISFNTSLIKELKSLDQLRQLRDAGTLALDESADLRLHMIHCETDVQELSASSKLNAEWRYLQHLFERGRIWAQDWLDQNLEKVGRQSSFLLDEFFQQAQLPKALAPLREA